MRDTASSLLLLRVCVQMTCHKSHCLHCTTIWSVCRAKKERDCLICTEHTRGVFAATQVMAKHREMQKELHMVFIDLEKAYIMTGFHCRKFEGVCGGRVCLKSMCAS